MIGSNLHCESHLELPDSGDVSTAAYLNAVLLQRINRREADCAAALPEALALDAVSFPLIFGRALCVPYTDKFPFALNIGIRRLQLNIELCSLLSFALLGIIMHALKNGIIF